MEKAPMGDPGWGEVVWALVQRFGLLWVIGVGALFWVLSKTDIIKWLSLRRTADDERKLAEYERNKQNWEDAQEIITRLQEDATAVRTSRQAEHDFYERLTEDLRKQLRLALDTISAQASQAKTSGDTLLLEQKGNARLRHMLNGALQWGATIRRAARRKGVDVPQFPLDDLAMYDPALAKHFQSILDDKDYSGDHSC